jgi:hypothetical protein
METSLTRNEKILAVVAISVVAGFFALFMQVNRGSAKAPSFESAHAIDYRMARPDQIYSEYTLEGREIDQTYEALKKAEDKMAKKKEELIAKQKIEDKKKADAKKKQSLAARIQDQIKTAKAQLEQQFLKAQEKIKDKMARSNETNTPTRGYNAYATDTAAHAPVVETAKDNKDKTVKKTFAEWRTLLLAKPTSENLALFVAAYRKGEVTSTEYQALATDLIDQSDVKLKALGLQALRAVPSLGSLSQLVHLEGLTAEYQAYVEQAINAYLMAQNVQYLNQALLTQDNTLVSKALNLLNTSLSQLSNGDVSSFIDPRNVRNGSVGTFSLGDYVSLVPALTQLSQSADQSVASLAQQVAALIKSSNNVAQN